MTHCSYCEEWAVINIPANPAPVCLDHALEFWTGLLTYAREHAEPSGPLQKHAACQVCKELSAATARVIAAADAANSRPPRPAPAPLRLASRRTPDVTRITGGEWSGLAHAARRA